MTPFYVLYDGNCSFCRRAVAKLRTADLTRRLTLVNAADRNEVEKHGLGRFEADALMRDLHGVEGDRVWKGYDAYRAIAARVPLLWPLWPFLYVWPVTAIARRVYRHVAGSRSCETAS